MVGLRHFKGINGKGRIRSDGTIEFSGARGAVLDFIRANPLCSQRWIREKTGILSPQISLYCVELEKAGLIELVYDEDDKIKQYRIRESAERGLVKRTITHQPTMDARPPDTIAKELTLKLAPQVETAALQKTMGITPSSESLSVTIRTLLQAGFEPTDIILTVMTEMESELNELRLLKNSVLTNLNAMGGKQ